MQTTLKLLIAGTIIAGISSCGSDGGSEGSSEAASGKTMGFVVSSMSYSFAEHDADPCPGGFNLGPNELRGEGVDFHNECSDPTATEDPAFRIMDMPGRMDGFDLDGAVSSTDSGQCPHDDFTGPNGEEGIDFALWRSYGCVHGLQKDGTADIIFGNAVVSGQFTILIELRGVDDERNDDAVEVQVYASTEAPGVSGDGSVLPYGTLSVHPDEFYHGTSATGPLVDGVVTVGPLDIKLHMNIQVVDTDYTLDDAFIRVELLPDGSAKGLMAGYQPIEESYEIFGRQPGSAGENAVGYTCSGMYEALQRTADGGYDPETGRCTSNSHAYLFGATQVFIAK